MLSYKFNTEISLIYIKKYSKKNHKIFFSLLSLNRMVFLRAKVIIIGDSCVGKSAICQVLGSDGGMYPKNYTSVTKF